MGTFAIAHRGFSARYRENTMEAVERALEHTSAVEVDVRATSDAVIVCVHDSSLQRTHGIDARVGQLTWAELHRLAPDVPRLSEVFAAFAHRAGWYLDLKLSRPRALDALLADVRSADVDLDTGSRLRRGVPLAAGSVALIAPDAELLQSVRADTGAGCLELIHEDSDRRELAVTGPFITAYAHGVVIPQQLATRRMLRLLRTLRLGSYVYTVNDARQYEQLERDGASGIFTDELAELA